MVGESNGWIKKRCKEKENMKKVIIAPWSMCVFVWMALIGFCVNLQAAITINPSNVLANAEAGFNYGGGIGISILGVLVVLGALMMGWRLKSGRGK